jgi:RNA polymerase sigma-70 factor (ECF subfamily)
MKNAKTGQETVVGAPNTAQEASAETQPVEPVIDQAVVESEEAFGRLVHVTSPRIYRFLVRMVRSPEDALDLTQEVFLAAHKSRSRFRVGAPALPYLLTIARRKAISLLRWRSVRSIVHPLGERHAELAEDGTPSPRDRAADRQRLREVQSALRELKPVERAAVVLRLFEERPYDEIARVMGKPIGTVKSLVFRAERKLRTNLETMRRQEL